MTVDTVGWYLDRAGLVVILVGFVVLVLAHQRWDPPAPGAPA